MKKFLILNPIVFNKFIIKGIRGGKLKRDLKINFSILDDIVAEIAKYKSALKEMKDATAKMMRLFEENKGETVTALKELYVGFTAEIEKCYTEVNDINSIFVSYIGEMEEIIWTLIPSYGRKLDKLINDLNNIYKNKIIPFENKDDEFASKADVLYDKYTSFWERLGDWFSTGFDFVKDFVIGGLSAIKDLALGILGLAWGIVKLTVALEVMRVTDPFGMTPNWAKDTVEGTETTISTILKDPVIIVEALAQEVSDNFEEKGAAYCIGYLVVDFAIPDLLDKSGKLSKLAKGKKVFDKIDISHLDDGGIKNLLTKADDAKLKELSKFVDELSDVEIEKLGKIDDELGRRVRKVSEGVSKADIRERVLKNIEESKIARESSNYQEFAKIDTRIYAENNNWVDKAGNKPYNVYEVIKPIEV